MRYDNRKGNYEIERGESISVQTPTSYIRILVARNGQTIVHLLDEQNNEWVPMRPYNWRNSQ